MEKVFIGKIVSTHGIKGELKIKSNFMFKDRVFRIGNSLIIDNQLYEIKSYRVHKGFDMVTLNSYTNINEVLFLLKKDVFFNKDDLELSNDEILDEELITYLVTDGDRVGRVLEIFDAGADNKIIRVLFDKEVLIPYNSPMVKKVLKSEKKIIVDLVDGI